MPWKEKSVMDKKKAFIKDYQSGNYSVSLLAQMYQISRKTAHKYIKRYEAEGDKGLEERSRVPKNVPRTTSTAIINEIVDTKIKYMSWGPKKIIARLAKDNPGVQYPCPGTAQHWLNVYGFVQHRKRRQQVPPYTEPFVECNSCNVSWSVDFKGEFRMTNGKYCYPLTLEDNYSRYLLLCVALESPSFEGARKWLEWAFREYGLPKAIRSDNGTPFAAKGNTGLSRLAIWLMQLGIKQERIPKGRPDQNGRLERFHRTLKDVIVADPKQNIYDQQIFFNSFAYTYNHVRPHEALSMKTPSEVHVLSKLKYPNELRVPEYGHEYMIRKIGTEGELYLDWKKYFVSHLLAGQNVGLKILEDGRVEVYYFDRHIMDIDIKDGRLSKRKRELYEARQSNRDNVLKQLGEKSRRDQALPPSRYARRRQSLVAKKRIAKK